jgi:surfactin synthase thioesterase subunit
MILYCLPYAGGSKSIYYGWKKHLDPSIILEPIELKGRGRRYDEGFYQDFDESVSDILLSIKNQIVNNEYAIFGHSFGSLLAYELYHKICDENMMKPKHMFFSGNTAPDSSRKINILHTLPDNEFLKEVIDLGGTPQELVENNELLQLVLPILRNDFRINESYIYKERKDKIECDITVFSGKDEDIIIEELLAWRNHCCRGFKIHMLAGDHFFINNNVENITNIINYVLNSRFRREVYA